MGAAGVPNPSVVLDGARSAAPPSPRPPCLAVSRADQQDAFPRPSGGPDGRLRSELQARRRGPRAWGSATPVGLDLVLSGSKRKKKLLNP